MELQPSLFELLQQQAEKNDIAAKLMEEIQPTSVSNKGAADRTLAGSVSESNLQLLGNLFPTLLEIGIDARSATAEFY